MSDCHLLNVPSALCPTSSDISNSKHSSVMHVFLLTIGINKSKKDLPVLLKDLLLIKHLINILSEEKFIVTENSKCLVYLNQTRVCLPPLFGSFVKM